LSSEQLNYIKNDILLEQFTTQGLRVILYAYKDLPVADYEQLVRSSNGFQTESDKEALESELCFVALFAL
jgi:magnesium-transporting ATPase (P-type)